MQRPSRPLPHLAFVERQDRYGPDAPQTALGRIAFMALRLVDGLDPRAMSLDRSPYAWTAALRLLEEAEDDGSEWVFLDGLLRNGADAAASTDCWMVCRDLETYAIHLGDREHWEEVADVLETAWRLERRGGGSAPIQLARHYLDIGDPAAAARVCRAATRVVGAWARPSLRLLRAGAVLTRDPARAERLYRRLLADPGADGFDLIDAEVSGGLARALLAQHRPIEAVLALQRCAPEYRGGEVLGLALEALGQLRAAARALWSPALGATNLRVRWGALTVLVRVLARAGNRFGFERARRLVGRYHADPLPPASLELDAVLETARGLACLGERTAARGMMVEAVAVARRARAPNAARRVRRAVVDCESPVVCVAAPDPEPPAQLRSLVARLAESCEPEEALAFSERS